MISDFIVAGRGLRRSPAFTVAAVVTLALGIGANSTMYSVVNSVLLRPLPGYETGRLMFISDAGIRKDLSPEVFENLRQSLESFETVAATQTCLLNLTGQGEPEQLIGPCATANWFEALRAPARLGRTFLPDEDKHGRNHVAVLDYAFWQGRFGGDERILDRKLILDGEPWTVIGVMPAGFRPAGVNPGRMYTPYVVADHPHGLRVIGRLRRGMTLASAQSELDAATARLEKDNPDLRLRATPLLEEVTGAQRPLLLLLTGAVSLVLLIACVNVANLMLARSEARRHEIEVRVALGAGRWRILRLVLAEALLIAAAAAVLAVGIAYAGLRVLTPLTARLPRAEELGLDWRVLAATMALGILSALLFGILPALRSTVGALRSPAGMGARTVTARPQRVLIASEVALALVLLAAAGLLLRTFAAIRSHDLGYDPQHVLSHFLSLRESKDGTRAVGAAEYGRIRERVAALPWVEGVATTSRLPMYGVSISMEVQPEGEPLRKQAVTAVLAPVSESYFRVMRIPLIAGRGFSSADHDGATRVAVVSESVERRFFHGHAIGRRVIVRELKFNVEPGQDVAVEIVGVAGNVCGDSVEDCDTEYIYLPEAQSAMRMALMVVRTAGDPLALAAAVRHAVFLEAPEIALDPPKTLEDRTEYLSRDAGRAMWVLSVFAGLATLLAAAGIFAVSAYLAAQRDREIGIRMALGATPGDIAGLIYRGTLGPSLAGLLIGVLGAAALTRLLRSLLYGVKPGDPKTLALAAIGLLLVAAVAAASPAVRAGLRDPAEVLRRE